MVNNWVDSSLQDTAVPKITLLLLITKSETVQQHIKKVLPETDPTWGAFTLQMSDRLPKEKDVLPDLFLLDALLLDKLGVDTAVFLETHPTIIISESNNVEGVFARDMSEIVYLSELNQTNLPRLIRKTIEQTYRLQKERRQRVLAEVLRDTSSSLNASLNFDEVLDQILTQVERLLPYDKVNVMLIDGDYTKVVRFWGYENYLELAEEKFVLSDASAFKEIMETQKPLLIPDVYEYENWVAKVPTTRSWLGAPILIDGSVCAFICLDKKEPYFYQEEHKDQLIFFAQQVALAMEKAQLYSAKQRQLDELSVLHKLTVVGVEANNEDEFIEKATQLIGEALYPDNFGVLLLDDRGENLRTHPSYQLMGEPIEYMSIPVTEGIVGYVARTKRPYISGDISEDEHYLQGASKTVSEICIPFFGGEQILGVINVESIHFNAFSAMDERLLVTLAHQLGMGIERMRLFEQERQRRKEAEILREAAMTLNATLDIDALLAKFLDFLGDLVSFDSAVVALPDEHGRLYIKAALGYSGVTEQTILSYTFEVTKFKTFQRVFQTQNVYLIDDTMHNADWEQLPETRQIRSWLGVPLVVGNQVIGCYSLDKAEPYAFTEADIKLAEALSSQTAVSLQNIQLIQISQQAAQESNIANSISQSLNATPDVSEVFPKLAQTLKHLTTCDFTSILLLTDKQEKGIYIALDEPFNSKRRINQVVETALSAATNDVLAGLVHQTPDIFLEMEGYPITEEVYEIGVRSQINIPLISGNTVIGSLNLGWVKKNGYKTEQIPLLIQIANAIALALERSRLFEEIKQWAENLTILHEFGRKITEEVEIDALCQTAVSYLTQSFHYQGVSVLLVDEKNEELILYAIKGVQKEITPPHIYRQKIGVGLIGHAAQQNTIIHVNDTTNNPYFLPSPRIDIKSEIALPLHTSGKLYGILDVNSDKYNAFTEDDVAILTIVADQLAISIGKAHLFRQTKQHAFELEAILELTSAMRGANVLDEMIPAILQQTLKITSGVLCSLYLVDEVAGDLVECGNYPFNPKLLGRRNSAYEGIIGHVVQTGEIYIAEDFANDPFLKFIPGEKEILGSLRSSINLPLQTKNKVIGVINVGFREHRVILENEIQMLTAVSEIAGSSLERALIMETLEQRVAERTSALADANERLKELDRLKSKFVADVSHELRTPIANLTLYLDLIEQGDPAKQKRYVAVLHSQTQRLTHLIEDTLNLSRIELGKDKISFHSFNLNELVEAVSAAHLPSVEAANLELSVQLAPDLPPLFGERNQMAQVVANLLANAINYTPEGEIKISTSWHEDVSEAWLVIADSGIGIHAEDIGYLYDRFYRGKSVSQSATPGTGLGLAIVKEIVDLHAGTIVVESEVDVGTTFIVKLPVYAGLAS